MTPEATLLAEAQRAPLVACPCLAFQSDPKARTCDFCGGITSPHSKDCEPCGGTGEIRSDVYQAVERAITVPCVDRMELRHSAACHSNPCGMCGEPCNKPPGRVLRPQPGVMACAARWWCYRGETFRNDGAEAAPWLRAEHPTDCAGGCKGSGTVSDPSEAGVVARDEACGRLWAVERALGAHGFPKAPSGLHRKLLRALSSGDYPGALAATLEAVRALAAQGAEA